MTCYCKPEPKPGPLYFVEVNYHSLGIEFQALDRDTNSRVEIVRQIRSGAIDPVKILEIDEVAGTCSDVTEELIAEAEHPIEHPEVRAFRSMLIDHARDLRKHEA